ncbi:MAG: LamG-like jellyroll fold domain-containing protein [Desulfoplanes sp.]
MSTWNWPSPGCVGLWHFQDNGNDSSVEANNATASGGVAYALGKIAKCTNLTADYFSLPYVDSLKVTDLTISCWYKSTSNDNPGVLLATSGIYVGSSSYGYYGYRFETRSGKATLLIMGTALIGSTAINDGAWHFLVATRNNSIARIYVDGRIDASLGSPPSLSYCNHGPASYYWAGAFIGAAYRPMIAPSTIGYYPTCYLDELKLLNYAESPETIQNGYFFQVGII